MMEFGLRRLFINSSGSVLNKFSCQVENATS